MAYVTITKEYKTYKPGAVVQTDDEMAEKIVGEGYGIMGRNSGEIKKARNKMIYTRRRKILPKRKRINHKK